MAGTTRAAVLSLLMALAGWPLASQELSISYLEGSASRKIGSAWQELSIGDTIPSDSTLRIDQRACLELSAGSVRITLTQPGTYGVKKILSASMSLQSTGAAKALTTKLAKLVQEPARKESSAGGARAEVIDRGQVAALMDDEAGVFLAAGKDFIGSGELDKAIAQLTRAVAAAADDQLAEARFYLAEAYSLNGDTRNALAQLAPVPADHDAAWFPDYVLLKGKVLVDCSAFDQAVKWMTGNGTAVEEDFERMPTYFFLLALAYGGAGDGESERQCLARVVATSGDSELGKSAARLMQDL
jgi:tetratricopeptide (TPR) repeat protein